MAKINVRILHSKCPCENAIMKISRLNNVYIKRKKCQLGRFRMKAKDSAFHSLKKKITFITQIISLQTKNGRVRVTQHLMPQINQSKIFRRLLYIGCTVEE
jgi:hypothetical protein